MHSKESLHGGQNRPHHLALHMSVIQTCSFSHSKTLQVCLCLDELDGVCQHQKCMVCKEEGCDAAGTLERSWLQRCDILSMLYVLAATAEYLRTGEISCNFFFKSAYLGSVLFQQNTLWPKPLELEDTLV